MKKVLILIAILIVASCSKENINTGHDLVVTASIEKSPENSTKTSLDGLNVSWTIGDKIKIFDETGNAAVYRVQSIDEANGDANFLKESGDDLSGDVVAYYPAENAISYNSETKKISVTIPTVQQYSENSFGQNASSMSCKGTIEDSELTLLFKNNMAILKLQLIGNSEQKISNIKLMCDQVICGPASVDLSTDIPSLTMDNVNGAKTVTLADCEASLSESAKKFYIVVPANTIAQNYSILLSTVESGESAERLKESSVGHVMKRNTILGINALNISKFTKMQPEANSYIIDASEAKETIIPFSQAIKAWDNKIKAGEGSFVLADIQAVLESGDWEVVIRTNTSGEAVTAGPKVTKNGVVYGIEVTTPSGINGNNIVFDLKTTVVHGTVPAGSIIWSWHLWLTNYVPGFSQAATKNGQVHKYYGSLWQTGKKYANKVIMDRHLGATIQSTNEDALPVPTLESGPLYYGLKFHYGDPTPDCSDVLRTAQKDAWADAKTVFDPCPAGWKVPESRTWDDFITSKDGHTVASEYWPTYGTSEKSNYGRRYVREETVALYPNNFATAYSMSCWSSTAYNLTVAYLLNGSHENAYSYAPGSTPRSNGHYVRCIQE